jgi:hypothetical protein
MRAGMSVSFTRESDAALVEHNLSADTVLFDRPANRPAKLVAGLGAAGGLLLFLTGISAFF